MLNDRSAVKFAIKLNMKKEIPYVIVNHCIVISIGHSACSACVMIDRAGIQIVKLLFYRACSFDYLHFKLFWGRRVEVLKYHHNIMNYHPILLKLDPLIHSLRSLLKQII